MTPNAFTLEGNDVAIPIFVIVELDDLKERKKGHVAFASRVASRTIQSIKGDDGDLQTGVYLPEQDITVRVIGTTGVEFRHCRKTTTLEKWTYG